MKKNLRLYSLAWVVLVLAFNVIVFLLPDMFVRINKSTGIFWIGYLFVMLSFIGQLICTFIAFKMEGEENQFLNLPLVFISFSALVVSILAGTIFMIIPGLPSWMGSIVCVVIFALYVIEIIKAKATANIVSEVEDRVKQKTFFTKSFTMDVENLMGEAKSEDVKAELRKIYEAMRYSDPMSNPTLLDIETKIETKFEEMSKLVLQGEENISVFSEEIVILIASRNRKCKLLK